MTATLLMLLCAPVLKPPARQPPPPAAENAPAVAPEQLSPEELQSRIDMYLGTIDRPVPPARWQRLGPDAVPVLQKIAGDAAELPTRRAKAIHGISSIGSADAPQLLLRLARDEKEPTVVRLAAVAGAGRILPRDRVVAELGPLMEKSGNGHVRRAAAEVLAAHGGCAAVKAQAKREDQSARMAKALQKCGAGE